VRLSDFDGKKGLLVLFVCRHCPYVRHVEGGIAQLARDYAGADLGIVAIGANDPAAYPEDAPESLAEQARLAGFTFPYLFDETQEVAKAYTAACTPDPFLFDVERRLVERGQLDRSHPGNHVPVTWEDIRRAIDAVLSDRPILQDCRPWAAASRGVPATSRRTSGRPAEARPRGSCMVEGGCGPVGSSSSSARPATSADG
jgi:thiol-disulfide isomerase/thioredoxin